MSNSGAIGPARTNKRLVCSLGHRHNDTESGRANFAACEEIARRAIGHETAVGMPIAAWRTRHSAPQTGPPTSLPPLPPPLDDTGAVISQSPDSPLSDALPKPARAITLAAFFVLYAAQLVFCLLTTDRDTVRAVLAFLSAFGALGWAFALGWALALIKAP